MGCGNPALISTISGYINPTTVTIADNALLTLTNVPAIINTPKTGGLVINGGVSVNLIGIEFEECGSFIIVTSPLSQGINVVGSSFISAHPAISCVWSQNNFNGKLNMTGWSCFTSDMVLWGVLASTHTGGFSGNAMRNINIETPVHNGQFVNGLFNIYNFETPVASAISFQRTGIPILRVNGATSVVNKICDATFNTTSQYVDGQILVVKSDNDNLVLSHNTGNLLLAGGVNATIPNSSSSSSNANIMFMWDSNKQKWIEVSRTGL